MSSLRSLPLLQRVAFTTSRLAEFVGRKELVAQTGQPVSAWPLTVLKELVDNAIDACEEAGIPPAIGVAVSDSPVAITITDNGRGIPAETIKTVLDYTVRVSSRESYVSPCRGSQGNALKTIIAMGFALDGACGTTIIESHGEAHVVTFELNAVRREPKITHEIHPSTVRIGTRITVLWPDSASSILAYSRPRFLQMAADFLWLNPHLDLRLTWNGEDAVARSATDPDWGARKWRACDPTSAFWYDVESFSRYMAAHVARDQDHGHARTVRDFIAELRGLTGTTKQKAVLHEAGAARTSLAAFFAEGKKRRPDAHCLPAAHPADKAGGARIDRRGSSAGAAPRDRRRGDHDQVPQKSVGASRRHAVRHRVGFCLVSRGASAADRHRGQLVGGDRRSVPVIGGLRQ